MSLTEISNIAIQKTSNSRLKDVDFDHLPFGQIFSDHMLSCDYKNGKWEQPKIVPYGPISLAPAAKIFHYGQSVFEGMKAYKDEDGKVWLFRPHDNYERLNKSSERLAMPALPESYFMEGLKTLINLDKDWIPTTKGSSLYIRPFIFATGEGFHASPADNYKFIIATAPSGAYFAGEVKVLIEEKYSRSANGGVGFAKAGGNYAAQFFPTQLAKEKGYQQIIWTDDNTHEYIEEAGSMNVFVRIGDTLLTCPTSDRILDGFTRKSIIELASAEGINVEVRKIKVAELIEAHGKGQLKEMFGAGTAAVISPIAGFGFQGKDYDLPVIKDNYADFLKRRITDIQYNRAEDKYGWTYLVE